MTTLVALAGASVCVLLWAEWRGWRAGVWIAKPLATTAIVGVAVACGATRTAYGVGVLVALLLSLAGDVLLIPRGTRTFVFGLAAFLAAHLAYAAAFLLRGVDETATLGGLLFALVAGGAALRWLRPHLSGPLTAAVPAYVVAIGVMVALAAGTAFRDAAPLILAGAVLFFVSDLAVARERFVRSGFSNRAWGLPLYFAGQALLAASV